VSAIQNMQLSWEPRPAPGDLRPTARGLSCRYVMGVSDATEVPAITESTGVFEERRLRDGDSSSAVLDFGVGMVVDRPVIVVAGGGGCLVDGGWTWIGDDG
jgi:hypothetical protein